jgi:hypothetical protein
MLLKSMIGSQFPQVTSLYSTGTVYLFSLSEFDKLIRLVQRQTNVAERVPGVFMKTIISLEASVNTATAKEKEAKKKMNQANAKALVGVKKKIKMAQKEHEGSLKQYQEVVISNLLLPPLTIFNRILKPTTALRRSKNERLPESPGRSLTRANCPEKMPTIILPP